MAPKKPEVIDNPPVGSSSEDEEGSSGSSGDESESSAEDSKKEESSKKLESESEGESESDSDDEPLNLKKQPVVTKSVSAVSVPESSNAKRPLKEAEDGEASSKKKLKTSTTTEVKKISGDEAKKMFQRLFSEADEIALLQGVLDFTSTKGESPSEESDAFCIYVKKLIDFNATKIQIQNKLQRLKKKFTNTVKKSLKKGKDEDEIKFAKDFDQKSFDLSRKIWGENGVLASKSRKKLGETSKEMKLVAHSTPKKQEETKTPERTETKAVNAPRPSIGREIASFFNLENASVCGLDESTIVEAWEKVGDGAKKKEMEEKWEKLKAMQVELCIQRTGLVAETAKVIFKANKS